MNNRDFYTVQELNQTIKMVLEDHLEFHRVVVKGEISNLTRHQSGHYYFTLKDEYSRIRCVMFYSYVQRLKFLPKEGDEVLVIASVSVYERSGEYQLYCYEMQAYGLGQYLLNLELLKKKLQQEGIFSRSSKPLPLIPRTIGVITSKSGAAVHDIVTTIFRRFAVKIYIYPCLVQGKDAPQSIIKAIKESERYSLDILIIGRGGGSFEDLIAYNDESLVRYVYTLKIPVISAVGHDINSTLLDLVADYSAITPTAAAEKATENAYRLQQELDITIKNLNKAILRRLEIARIEITNAMSQSVLNDFKTRYQMIQNDIVTRINASQTALKWQIERLRQTLSNLMTRLNIQIAAILRQKRETLSLQVNHIESLNPYKLLSKGYGMVYNTAYEIISSSTQLHRGDEILIKLKDGNIRATIISIEEENHGKKDF